MPSRKRSEKPALRTQPASVSSTSAVGRAPSPPAARGRAIQHDSPLATMARNRPRSYHTNLAIRGESLPATPTKAPGQLSRPGFSIFLDDSADDSLFASQSPSAARPIAGINALNKRQNKKENPIPRDQRSRQSVNAGKSLGELSAYTHVHRKSPGLQGRTLPLGSKTPDPNTSLAMVSSKAGLPGTATDKISQKDPQLLHKRVSTSASTNYSTHLPQHAQEVEVVPPTISALPRSPHETDIVNPTPPWISSQSSTNRSPAQHSYVHPPLRHVSRSNVFSSSFSPTFADRLLADLTTPTRRHVFSPLAASTPKFLKRWRASNDAVAHESDDMEIDMSPSPTQSRKRRKVNRASGDSLFSSLGNTTRSHNTASSWTSSAVLASLRARSNTSMSKESDMSLSSVVEPTGPLPHGASDNGSHDITDTPRLSALKPALSRSSRLSAPGVSSFSISASLRPSTRLTHSASTGPQSSTSRQTGMTDSLFSASGAGTTRNRISFAPDLVSEDRSPKRPSHTAVPRRSSLKVPSNAPRGISDDRLSRRLTKLRIPHVSARSPPHISEPDVAQSAQEQPEETFVNSDEFNFLPPRAPGIYKFVPSRGPRWSKFLNRELTPSDEEHDELVLISRPCVQFLPEEDYVVWYTAREKREKRDSSPVFVRERTIRDGDDVYIGAQCP